jgi:DNA-binding MarR family transcriptional regulator
MSDGEPNAALRLENFLPYRLMITAHFVSVALSRIYGDRHNLSISEWRILATLGEFGGMTAKAVGAYTSMHKTKVSRCVALMEKRRHLSRSRNRDDLREATLSLTAAGQRIYEDLAPLALEFEAKVLSVLDLADREAFYRALEKIKAEVT